MFITSNRASRRRGISELQSHHHAHEPVIYFYGNGVLVIVIVVILDFGLKQLNNSLALSKLRVQFHL